MEIKKDRYYRADLYYLDREGVAISEEVVGDRLGELDRPHIFVDGTGEIMPASTLWSDRCTTRFKGRTFKQGSSHSHPQTDSERLHVLEHVSDPARDLLKRFRKTSRDFRDRRQKRE